MSDSIRIFGEICTVPSYRISPLGKTTTRFVVSSDDKYISCVSLSFKSMSFGDKVEVIGKMLNNDLIIEEIKEAPAEAEA